MDKNNNLLKNKTNHVLLIASLIVSLATICFITIIQEKYVFVEVGIGLFLLTNLLLIKFQKTKYIVVPFVGILILEIVKTILILTVSFSIWQILLITLLIIITLFGLLKAIGVITSGEIIKLLSVFYIIIWFLLCFTSLLQLHMSYIIFYMFAFNPVLPVYYSFYINSEQ